MFTGLVECLGIVRACSASKGTSGTIEIETTRDLGVKYGESVSVSGVCLTVVRAGTNFFAANMMPETLAATKLGQVSPGDAVNLERALSANGRLDGHIVQGHVDAVGSVAQIEAQAGASDTKKLWIEIPREIAWGIAHKGSVAIDGVSLTVIDARDEAFSVGLIPATLKETTIGALRIGDPVNIEIDVVARYLARMLSVGLPDNADFSGEAKAESALTWDKLHEYGWS